MKAKLTFGILVAMAMTASAQSKTTAPGLIYRPPCTRELTLAARAVIGPEVTDTADKFIVYPLEIIGVGVPALCPSCPTTTIGATRQKKDAAVGKAAELTAALATLERLREAVLSCEAAGY